MHTLQSWFAFRRTMTSGVALLIHADFGNNALRFVVRKNKGHSRFQALLFMKLDGRKAFLTCSTDACDGVSKPNQLNRCTCSLVTQHFAALQ